MNRRYKQQKPQKVCIICGDKATGINFNATTCMSCKAFFRRNALRTKVFQCPFEDNCQITKITRKFCAKCRIKRCFDVGMKKEWILSEEEKAEMKERIARNRETKQAKMLEQLQILKPSQCFSCKTPTSTPPTSPPVVSSTSTSPLLPQPQPPPLLLQPTTPTTLIRQSVIVAPSTSPPPSLQATAAVAPKETPALSVGHQHSHYHHPFLTPSAAAAVFDVLNKTKNTSTVEPKATTTTEEDKPKPKVTATIKTEIPEPTISLKNVLITECEKMLLANKSASVSSSAAASTALSNSVSVSLAGGIPISIFHQHLSSR